MSCVYSNCLIPRPHSSINPSLLQPHSQPHSLTVPASIQDLSSLIRSLLQSHPLAILNSFPGQYLKLRESSILVGHFHHYIHDTPLPSPLSYYPTSCPSQAHGAMGLSSDRPLAQFFSWTRILRLADGPDEVHTTSIGKMELKEK